MQSFRLTLLWLLCALGGLTAVPRLDSPCGDWIPYKNEDCIKLVTRSGAQNKVDADVVCQALGEEGDPEHVPKIVKVQTKEKQEFLQEMLFVNHRIFDDIWLGLELGNDSVFRWNDGTEVYYSNWAENNVSDQDHRCVQMESGENVYKTGVWVRANCKKSNAVVCERTQTWSVTRLQNIVLSLKLEVERNKQASDKIIDNLIRNPVPLGFIYAQLPNQDPPTKIWPSTQWTDVSASYAGHFFRVAGGGAAPFGQTQESSSPRLAYVEWRQMGNDGAHTSKLHSIPANGAWSDFVHSGDWDGFRDMFLRFQLSAVEVRPRNQAVVIWKRTA